MISDGPSLLTVWRIFVDSATVFRDREGLAARHPSDEVYVSTGLEIRGLKDDGENFRAQDQMSFGQTEALSDRVKDFTVYCLRSAVSRRTYVGATVDLTRRLRQHNGALKGGAKYTSSNRPWELAGTVTGFATFREALQLEWRWKKTRVRRSKAMPPIDRRREALQVLLRKEPWVGRPLTATFLGQAVSSTSPSCTEEERAPFVLAQSQGAQIQPLPRRTHTLVDDDTGQEVAMTVDDEQGQQSC